MAGRSCSTCSAISTRCRSPAARRSASWAGCRSRASRRGRPTARPSRSSPIAPASRTCGSPTPMARTRARSARTAAPTIGRRSWCRRRGRRTATTSWCRSRVRPSPGTFGLFMYHRDGGTGVRVGPAPPPQPGPDAQGPPPAPPTNKMGAVVSPDGRFIYYTQRTGTFTYNARFPLWQIYRHDTRDRRRHADHQRAGQRHPPGDLARRQVDGLRHAPQGADRPARPQSRDRRGALARLSGDARRSGIARQPRHAAALRLHARRQVADRAGRTASCSASISPPATRRRFRSPRRWKPRSRRASTRRCAWKTAPTVRARLIRWPSLSPDGTKLVFSAMNRLYVMDYPERRRRAC